VHLGNKRAQGAEALQQRRPLPCAAPTPNQKLPDHCDGALVGRRRLVRRHHRDHAIWGRGSRALVIVVHRLLLRLSVQMLAGRGLLVAHVLLVLGSRLCGWCLVLLLVLLE
jgi:hypothetical protein